MRNLLASLFLTIIVATFASGAYAQWRSDGVALCTAASYQYSPTSVSDGSGGEIVAWFDHRSGSDGLYAQRVDAWGIPLWTADGVAVSAAVTATSDPPTIVSDGSGGSIVSWSEGGQIHAQRLDASGVPQWQPGGVVVCATVSGQTAPTSVSDGSGGAIVTWYDYGNTDPYRAYGMYARRVDASGVPQWSTDGVALSTAARYEFQYPATIVSDGSGGAIVSWYDHRGLFYDIYAQRVDASGVPQWTADGVALSTAADDQGSPTSVSDGSGGAIVSWYDYGSGTYGIYAQRVDASGVAQWTADGVALSTAVNYEFQYPPVSVSDGSGGAIVSWYDIRSGASYDIYAQRVDASGVAQWTANGVALSTAANDQVAPTIASDGSGGAIVSWYDRRSGSYDIYARRVDASGVPQWTANGVALSTAANNQFARTIVSDDVGGAIVTWEDYRSGVSDIYAQHVSASGDVPTAVAEPRRGPSPIVGEIYPNPFSGIASIDIELDAPSVVRVEIFDVAGRRVREMTLSDAVSQRVEFDGRSDRGQLLASGVYFYRVRANGTTVTRKMVIAR